VGLCDKSWLEVIPQQSAEGVVILLLKHLTRHSVYLAAEVELKVRYCLELQRLRNNFSNHCPRLQNFGLYSELPK
jgi:hypothetical protein